MLYQSISIMLRILIRAFLSVCPMLRRGGLSEFLGGWVSNRLPRLPP